MYNTILCIVALADLYPADAAKGYVDKVAATHVERLSVCVEVANKAEEHGVKPSLAVAIAYEESRFDDRKVSSAGAVGAMQVIPAYTTCKRANADCDWVKESLVVLKRWVKRYPKGFLCHYNSGNKCNPRSRAYARRVERRRYKLKRQVGAISYDFER